MRAFAACLTVVLGFGAFSAVGCSSDAKTGGTAGDAGEAGATTSPTAGSAGKPSGGAPGEGGAPGAGAEAGATPEGGAAGAGGAAACGYDSDACTACLIGMCGTETNACSNDAACGGGIAPLRTCACDGTSTIDQCEMDFATTGGDLAGALVTCFNDKCATACQ